MKVKLFFAAFLLLGSLVSTHLSAQAKFEVPENPTLDTEEDYAKYEKTMVDAAKWLENTPLNKDEDKRKRANAFVLQWLSGTSSMTFDLGPAVMDLVDKNPDLLGIYMASYARYMIEHKSTPSTFKATKAALNSIVKVYRKGINIKKAKPMEKLEKAASTNKLDAYITDEMGVSKED